jgi:hypothetical protein
MNPDRLDGRYGSILKSEDCRWTRGPCGEALLRAMCAFLRELKHLAGILQILPRSAMHQEPIQGKIGRAIIVTLQIWILET